MLLSSDPAVGAKPGEIEPWPVQTQVLLVQSAGQRAPKPQEPPRRGQPALQKHAGTPWSLLCVLLPRPGKKSCESWFTHLANKQIKTQPISSGPVLCCQVCSRDEVTLRRGCRTLSGGNNTRRGLPSSLKALDGQNRRSKVDRHCTSQVTHHTADLEGIISGCFQVFIQ